MEIGAKVEAEHSHSGERQHIVSAYLTFIALGADDKPVPVPELVPETEAEKLRWGEAQLRREQRLRQAEEIKRYRQNNSGNA